MLIEDEALVLKRTPYRNSSLIIALFTVYHGRIDVVARGIRGSRGQERAALSGFHTISMACRIRASSKLGFLTRSEIVTPRHHLPGMGLSALAAFLVLETVYRWMPAQDPHPDIASLLCRTLNGLERHENPLETATRFYLCFLKEIGYASLLDRCAGCGLQDSTTLTYFSPRRWHAVCHRCGAPYAARLFVLSPSLKQLLNHPENNSVTGLPSLSHQEQKRLCSAAHATLSHHTGISLQAGKSFLKACS